MISGSYNCLSTDVCLPFGYPWCCVRSVTPGDVFARLWPRLLTCLPSFQLLVCCSVCFVMIHFVCLICDRCSLQLIVYVLCSLGCGLVSCLFYFLNILLPISTRQALMLEASRIYNIDNTYLLKYCSSRLHTNTLNILYE
jgi:hypothetical protein